MIPPPACPTGPPERLSSRLVRVGRAASRSRRDDQTPLDLVIPSTRDRTITRRTSGDPPRFLLAHRNAMSEAELSRPTKAPAVHDGQQAAIVVDCIRRSERPAVQPHCRSPERHPTVANNSLKP